MARRSSRGLIVARQKVADTFPQSLTRRAVLSRTGLAAATLDAFLQNGGFPKPLPDGRWDSGEIESWAAINLIARALDET